MKIRAKKKSISIEYVFITEIKARKKNIKNVEYDFRKKRTQ